MAKRPTKIRGIRSPIPKGFLLGRTDGGHGDAHPIKANPGLSLQRGALTLNPSGDVQVDPRGIATVTGIKNVPVDDSAKADTYVLSYDAGGNKIIYAAPGGGGGTGDVVGPSSATDNAISRFDTTTGKLIQDSPVTVADDGTMSGLADPASLQDAATKNYVDTQIAGLNVGGAAQSTFLVSGGQVVWQTAYQFSVSAAVYYIGGVQYTSASQNITLDTADLTDDRIDVIAVDDTGTVVKITGTPAAQPSEPDVDPGTQLKLSIVFVGAGSSAPAGASSTLLYEDDTGGPGEWNWTASGSGITLNATSDPHSGTKYIDGTAVTANSYAQGQIPSGSLDPSTQAQLVFYLKSKAKWNPNRGLQVSLRSTGVLVGTSVSINSSGTFGFDSSSTSAYQLVAIPISQFAVAAGLTINQVRFTDFGGSIGFELDTISFQTGATSQTPTGITQAQADARYAPITPSYVLVANDPTLPNDRKLTAGAGISLTDGGAGGNLTIAATGGGGTVTTTGSPASGNLTKFSGSTSVTNGDLSGDISTSGTLVTTIGAGKVTEAMQVLADNTTQNVSSTKHGYVPKSPADATQFLNGAATPAFAAVKDSDLSTSDVTTNNASTSKHGFVPKLPNDATKYYDGTGAYSVPSGGGGGSPGGSSGQIQYNNSGAFGGFTASGDVAINTGTGVATIQNDAVTYAKMQNVSATSRLLGRKTAGAGDTEELTLSEALDLVSSAAQGDILYRSGALWARLAASTSGYVLATGGAGADPSWIAPSTVTITGDGAFDTQWFGDGSDGDLTASSGTTTLTRDTYYNNVTLSGTGKIKTANFRLYIAGTLDISAAGAGAIFNSGTAGANSTSATGGARGVALVAGTLDNPIVATPGATATTGAGAQASQADSTGTARIGGAAAIAGAGGAVGASAGGAARNPGTYQLPLDPVCRLAIEIASWNSSGAYAKIAGGQPGSGGSSGAGDGTGTGGGGGGGGSGAGVLWVAARTINRGGSTAVGTFQCTGGNGGNGANGGSGGTNRGGGGGAAGAGGGPIYLIYRFLTGSTATNAIDATGGDGGAGGNGVGTGIGGDGAGAGAPGPIYKFDLGAGTLTKLAAGVAAAGNAHSSGTGGLAKTATAQQVSL